MRPQRAYCGSTTGSMQSVQSSPRQLLTKSDAGDGGGGAAGVHCTACSDDVSSTGFKAVAERPKPSFHDDTPRRRRCGSIRREAIKAEGLRAVNQPVSLSIMRVRQRNNSDKKEPPALRDSRSCQGTGVHARRAPTEESRCSRRRERRGARTPQGRCC